MSPPKRKRREAQRGGGGQHNVQVRSHSQGGILIPGKGIVHPQAGVAESGGTTIPRRFASCAQAVIT